MINVTTGPDGNHNFNLDNLMLHRKKERLAIEASEKPPNQLCCCMVGIFEALSVEGITQLSLGDLLLVLVVVQQRLKTHDQEILACKI